MCREGAAEKNSSPTTDEVDASWPRELLEHISIGTFRKPEIPLFDVCQVHNDDVACSPSSPQILPSVSGKHFVDVEPVKFPVATPRTSRSLSVQLTLPPCGECHIENDTDVFETLPPARYVCKIRKYSITIRILDKIK